MNRISQGDCLEVMAGMDAASIDAIVTDPPYGLKFMGKDWDHGIPGPHFWQEALRVVKPGSFMLAFGGTRTFHRLTCAIEDGGWEIRDCLMWLYGQGFPKGKGCLKPAWEPVILARKAGKRPALQVDDCRLETVPPSVPQPLGGTGSKYGFKDGTGRSGEMSKSSGRWPANVMLDEEAAAMLDEQSGILSKVGSPKKTTHDSGMFGIGVPGFQMFGDSGGASRFFYCAKASRSEREAGLSGPHRIDGGVWGGDEDDLTIGKKRVLPVRNGHPTVKPLALMRWLCRLITPPNGIILDPFAGSGTTGCAAVQEGFGFIGIEKQEEYVTIANARVAHWHRTSEPTLPMEVNP